ncbi:MAG: YggS family pyridoxal phosphate-dependent enzyme, partial [Candidatus Eremiobacteraeota bacterium]|nr:YggS family pyridoxal phosphate-dependent enzyme [Candidatus Eremiobacteraeota bacterium]
AELADVKRAAGRSNDPVTVVTVTKTQPRDRILEAIEAGATDIGENYLQEAREKFADLPAVRKHFLGHVQTNKAKGIVEEFDMVQSVDRLDAGRALAKAARTVGKTLAVLVQVNISATERFGTPPDGAERLAEQLREEGLVVEGVMAIGPNSGDENDVLRAFERAAQTFSRVGGKTLSLGMSGDWPQAVRCGSTMIRLGTSLFGPRAQKTPAEVRG